MIERFFGALQYEHLYCGLTGDGSALHMEVHRYQRIYNPIRPHQVLGGHSQSRGT
ncbi:integrase core domain-containing protein [Prescottella equi]